MTRRNVIPLLAVFVVLSITAFFYSDIRTSETWRSFPQHVGLGEHIGSNAQPHSADPLGDPDYTNWNPKPVFKPGSPMPPGHNYTSTLIIAKTKKEDIGWLLEKVPEQDRAVYVADDPTAPLHPTKNKGHEVMIYLSWIIDNYDNLPDVAIFMHAHQLSWHNDVLLGNDAHEMITRLSRPRVWREGFVNMKCTWLPGCPDWMHPGMTEQSKNKPEEVLLAKSWSELFPLDEIPSVLAQPCCAQFALSRERIQAKPLAQYVWYRDWVFNTQLPDYLSGRIFEYIWQFIFTGQNIYCPKEHVCFCDQYGVCFGGEEEYDNFKALEAELSDNRGKLLNWYQRTAYIAEAKKQGNMQMLREIETPEPGKDEEYRREIDRLKPMVDQLKHDAYARGDDPRNRALEVGREWKEGDGF
ncbi:hypothetical protein COCVIDRAFT_92483 [Bipolaris victoriae FI3]|uniref:Uncharacterized protein n=1 Tax=Bipolaris victoriae (strain FI3) TaxID=930091 RepID=W7EGF3_BIPV3|nr:hypothetical protein COCVIDRAFT_92483 [Bipolaris victoriae FI3]